MRELKECDGTWQDYHRHRRRGQAPCVESKASWRRHVATLRKGMPK